MIIATAMCLVVHGCSTVDGGAAELSWRLRPAASAFEEPFVNCDSGQKDTGPVTTIRLDWEVLDQDMNVHAGSEEWSCGDSHGVTAFELAAGEGLFSVTPVCGTGADRFVADTRSYIAPAPEQRRVIVGETVSLGAVELILHVTDCTVQTCICE